MSFRDGDRATQADIEGVLSTFTLDRDLSGITNKNPTLLNFENGSKSFRAQALVYGPHDFVFQVNRDVHPKEIVPLRFRDELFGEPNHPDLIISRQESLHVGMIAYFSVRLLSDAMKEGGSLIVDQDAIDPWVEYLERIA